MKVLRLFGGTAEPDIFDQIGEQFNLFGIEDGAEFVEVIKPLPRDPQKAAALFDEIARKHKADIVQAAVPKDLIRSILDNSKFAGIERNEVFLISSAPQKN